MLHFFCTLFFLVVRTIFFFWISKKFFLRNCSIHIVYFLKNVYVPGFFLWVIVNFEKKNSLLYLCYVHYLFIIFTEYVNNSILFIKLIDCAHTFFIRKTCSKKNLFFSNKSCYFKAFFAIKKNIYKKIYINKNDIINIIGGRSKNEIIARNNEIF